jgi:hypothetical protein
MSIENNYIKSWNIVDKTNLLEKIKIQNTGSFLLNTNKSHFNVIEKLIYDLAIFHFERLQIPFDTNIHHIEFWLIKTVKIPNFHMDCDESEKQINKKYIFPICSSITYFNDNQIPTCITNISETNCKYKEIPIENQIILSFPKKNKHICFDGSKYHGIGNIFEEDVDAPRNILAINLWDRKPTNVKYYSSNDTTIYSKQNLFELKEDNNICELLLDTKQINFDFYEDILYKRTNAPFLKLKDIFVYENEKIKDLDNTTIPKTNIFEKYNSFIISTNVKPLFNKKEYNRIKMTHGEIIDEIYPILLQQDILTTNRFYQRYVIDRFYTPDICEWIVSEAEQYAANNGGWTTSRHMNYPTTDIPAKNIPFLFNFVLISIKRIFEHVKTNYKTNNINFDINDIFIVKYNENIQNKLSLHKDGSFISFNVMLNDKSEYEGGGTFFKCDKKTFMLEKGDLLIHSGQLEHSGIEITKGTRYLLVFFVNLVF